MKPMTLFSYCFWIGFGLTCGFYSAKAIQEMSQATGNYAYYKTPGEIPVSVRCKGE